MAFASCSACMSSPRRSRRRCTPITGRGGSGQTSSAAQTWSRFRVAIAGLTGTGCLLARLSSAWPGFSASTVSPAASSSRALSRCTCICALASRSVPSGCSCFAANTLSALSFLAAAPLAPTHRPAQHDGIHAFALEPSSCCDDVRPSVDRGRSPFGAAAGSQMDVPTRQAYTMALVAPEERTAAASVTSLARSAGSAVSPVISGALLQGALLTLGLPFYRSRRNDEVGLRPDAVAILGHVPFEEPPPTMDPSSWNRPALLDPKQVKSRSVQLTRVSCHQTRCDHASMALDGHVGDRCSRATRFRSAFSRGSCVHRRGGHRFAARPDLTNRYSFG